MKKVMLLVVGLSLVSMLQADIISFDAEDAGLISVAGTNWRTEAAAGAAGGLVITPDVPHGGDDAVAEEIRTYSVDIAAGTYGLYARVNKREGIYDGWGSGESFWNDSAFFADSLGDAVAPAKWNSMLGDTGLDGVATLNNFGWVQLPGSFVQAADGTGYFRAAPREPLLIDAFAFVTDGQTVTDAELNRTLGIPEPATMVLLGLGSLAALKRRRG